MVTSRAATRRDALAIGFRVKSGHAVAVGIEGTASSPVAVGRCDILLSDMDVPATRQPYHDGFTFLFRTVLQEALGEYHIPWEVNVEKTIDDAARKRLRVSDKAVRETIETFGAGLGRPWRSDEKRAALAAWMALATK